MTKPLVERALEGEMSAYLGYEKHAPEGRNRKNFHNGRAVKRVKTSTSESTWRCRAIAKVRSSQLLPQRRTLPGFDEKLALYARGMTTRDNQGHLKEIYGVTVSPSLISAVTDSVMEDVTAWQSRPLDAVYPIVYLDALHVKVRETVTFSRARSTWHWASAWTEERTCWGYGLARVKGRSSGSVF